MLFKPISHKAFGLMNYNFLLGTCINLYIYFLICKDGLKVFNGYLYL